MTIKKLLLVGILVTALVSVNSLPGSAEKIIKNLKIDGGIDVRMMSLNNMDRLNTVAATGLNDDLTERTLSRLMIGISGDVNKSISSRVDIVKNDRLFGTVPQFVLAAVNLLRIQNAYIDIKNEDGLNIRIGRQPLGEEGDMVMYFGKNNNNALTVTACDAINVDFPVWKLDFNLLYSKLNETSGLTPATQLFYTDTDLAGLSIATDELLPKTKAKIFYYNRIIQNPVAALVDGVGIVGLKAIVTPIDDFSCTLEAALNLGTGYSGNGVAFNAAYKKELGFGILDAGFDFASGSGDDVTTAAVNEGFVPISSDKRYGEVVGKNLAGMTNMGVIGGYVDITPSGFADSKLKAGLGLYSFTIKTTAVGIPVATAKGLGTEIDIKVSYSITEKSTLDVSYGVFSIPTNAYYFAGDTNTDAIAQILATVSVMF